jgi:GPH family glycoside/pentoside/hexuronide:cation symporter
MSPKSIFAYSFQSFYLAGSFLLLFIFLPSFYNLSLGFALSTLGLIILVSRFFDVFSDMYIGFQTEKRFINGKSKKNQIQFGVLIFILSLVGLYVVQPSNIYLFIFYYNLALISYSIAIIPYDSIVIDQKKISTRRFQLATIKEIFTILGVICAFNFSNDCLKNIICRSVKSTSNKTDRFFYDCCISYRNCNFSFLL